MKIMMEFNLPEDEDRFNAMMQHEVLIRYKACLNELNDQIMYHMCDAPVQSTFTKLLEKYGISV